MKQTKQPIKRLLHLSNEIFVNLTQDNLEMVHLILDTVEEDVQKSLRSAIIKFLDKSNPAVDEYGVIACGIPAHEIANHIDFDTMLEEFILGEEDLDDCLSEFNASSEVVEATRDFVYAVQEVEKFEMKLAREEFEKVSKIAKQSSMDTISKILEKVSEKATSVADYGTPASTVASLKLPKADLAITIEHSNPYKGIYESYMGKREIKEVKEHTWQTKTEEKGCGHRTPYCGCRVKSYESNKPKTSIEQEIAKIRAQAK